MDHLTVIKKIPQLVSCCIPVTRDLGPVRTGVPMKVAPCWWNVETKGNIEIYVFANILFERAPIVLIDLVYIWIQYIRKVNYLIQKLRRRSDFFSITCVVGCCHNTTDNSLQVIDIRQNKLETLILKHALTWFVFMVLLEILCMCYPPTLTAMPGLVWRQFNPCGSQFRRLCHKRGQ